VGDVHLPSPAWYSENVALEAYAFIEAVVQDVQTTRPETTPTRGTARRRAAHFATAYAQPGAGVSARGAGNDRRLGRAEALNSAGFRATNNEVGREVSFERLYEKARSAYSGADSPDDAHDALFEASNSAQSRFCVRLRRAACCGWTTRIKPSRLWSLSPRRSTCSPRSRPRSASAATRSALDCSPPTT